MAGQVTITPDTPPATTTPQVTITPDVEPLAPVDEPARQRYRDAFKQEPPPGYPHQLPGAQGLDELAAGVAPAAGKALSAGASALKALIAHPVVGPVIKHVVGTSAGFCIYGLIKHALTDETK